MAYFYDLCGAMEELSRFFDVELEAPAAKSAFVCADSSLEFREVRGEARGIPVTLNFRIDDGATVMAACSTHGLQRLVTTLLKRQLDPDSGMVMVGGADIVEAEPHALHQQIVLLDRPIVVAMTIREFLQLAGDNVTSAQVLDAVRIVGLDTVISRFEKGLDTPINLTGWPLSITETMLLKLAAAILAEPRVLILNQLYDLAPEDVMIRVLDYLKSDRSNTVIYFTRRQRTSAATPSSTSTIIASTFSRRSRRSTPSSTSRAKRRPRVDRKNPSPRSGAPERWRISIIIIRSSRRFSRSGRRRSCARSASFSASASLRPSRFSLLRRGCRRRPAPASSRR
jgi:ABC-type branched-subunit amino acid transport system ATPase component